MPKAILTLNGHADMPTISLYSRSNGTFEFEPVVEGAWRISAKMDRGDGPRLWAAQWVQLNGHDLEKLEVRPVAPFAIHGKMVMEVPDGAVAPKPPGVTLAFNDGPGVLSNNPAGPFVDTVAKATGEFQIPRVYPGTYQILPGPAPPQYYLDSIRLGGYDALGSAVEIASGAQSLTVVYKYGGGAVRGKAENCASGTVRLIPQDKTLWREGFLKFTPCDSNGRYEIASVRPGDYYVIAIAGDSPIPWYGTAWDDNNLVQNAVTVTVRVGESTGADLRAIRP
jgi:hypothetical protein